MLLKSRNPIEHGFRLENQNGKVVQCLVDGYNLIEFESFKIKDVVKINSKKKWVLVSLQWYVHQDDFKKF